MKSCGIGFVVSLVMLSAMLDGCGKDPAAQSQAQGGRGGGRRGAMRFPVEVALVEARRVEYRVSAVGSVEAFEVVQMTARVSGVVEQVRFAEGDVVKPGQVLVEIEPERYRLTVQSARATFEKAEAGKAEAEDGVTRREGVITKSPGLIPGEELETWRTRVRTATAELAQVRAALDLVELNLRDAFVRAPVAGIIQTRTVQTGQYVQPGTILATLVRRDPLLLRFQVPELDATRIRPGMRARFSVRGNDREFSARITHVGEMADEASRMVSINAEIDDSSKNLLRPGAFAQVTVPVGEQTNTPVIPQIAVRPSERGFLAYVVEKDVAKERVLDVGMRTADGHIEVRTGIRPGEMLVVRGAEALREGAPVRVMNGERGAKPGQPRRGQRGGTPTS
ncbi:MAG: efflux RND transporter periplasmic adaptor subunit [Candidatus Latescibacteria bacterium]|nr:efflux RND transporter periplasmic adaptor subunit [Candidatus Latescibacterota bacterium]